MSKSQRRAEPQVRTAHEARRGPRRCLAAAIASSTGARRRESQLVDRLGIEERAIVVADACGALLPSAASAGRASHDARAPAAASARRAHRTSPRRSDRPGSVRFVPVAVRVALEVIPRASRWDRAPQIQSAGRESARCAAGAAPPARCVQAASMTRARPSARPRYNRLDMLCDSCRMTFSGARRRPRKQQPGRDPGESAERRQQRRAARGPPKPSAYRLPQKSSTPASEQHGGEAQAPSARTCAA